MDTSSYLGIDFGTSGVRACLIDTQRQVITDQRLPLPEPERHSNRITQQPALWWQALEDLLDKVSRHPASRHLRAIAVDGTAGTLLLTDSLGNPLCDAMMYHDSSAASCIDKIRAQAPEGHICISATSSLAKALALQTEFNDAPIAHCLHQSDWILGKLSGNFGISDENNALKLGYDPRQRLWPEWIQTLVNPEYLPKVYPAGTAIGTITDRLAQRWRFPPDMQIVTGTTDSTASVIATGVHVIGQAVTVLGSTMVLKVLADKPVEDSRFGIYSHRLGDQRLVGGASNTGGAVLKQYFSQQQLDAMTPQLNPDQVTGLDYYPLPGKGERFPINDPELAPRLSPRPDNDIRFFQGMLESIARIEKQGYEQLHALGAPYPDEVFTAGGGAQNAAWCEIRQQSLGVPVRIATHQEAAYGSALLAMKGVSA